MKFFSNLIYTLSFLCWSTNIVCAQFTSAQTCLGGSNDDRLYPKYINTENTNYSFKTKDGGSIYFGSSNSTDGTFTPNKGYNDLVVIKIGADGDLAFTKNYGNSFYEHDFIVTQNTDSTRFFILLESHSNDSFYTNDYEGSIIIIHTLFCIDQQGNELWNKVLRTEDYYKNDRDYFPSPHYENQINLFTDKQDNSITFFEKIRFDSIVHYYIIDSIFYNKTDKNGNINWTNATTPFAIYNNTKPELRIDTFFNYSFRSSNNFAVTDNQFFTSAFLSNNRAYSTALYTLDYNTGNISNSILIDSVNFNICSVKNNILLYGNKSVFDYDYNSGYSSFLYRKYDENLNIIYENLLRYNEIETYTHKVFISPYPYFNLDSTKIWFNTYISVLDLQLYYGILIGITGHTFTYANIVDEQTGTYIKQVDLNKMESNFIVSKLNDVLYYLSINSSPDSLPGRAINAYNFDGTLIHNKILDTAFILNNNQGNFGMFFNLSTDNSQAYCNITNTIALQYNSLDSFNNIFTGFIVLDSLCNFVMNGYDNSFSQNYLLSKFHIIDTNKYSLIYSVLQDTISGCYPNTNNIVLKIFSKPNLSSLNILHKNEAMFLIFPNPNNGNFKVNFSAKGNYPITISLTDITGKIIYQQSVQHNNQSLLQISDAGLAAGMYNIQISSASDVWNNKVLITK